MDKKYRNITIIVVSVFLLLIGIVLTVFSATNSNHEKEEISQKSYELPKINIFLENITFEELNSNPKNIKYPGNKLTFTVEGEDYDFENVEIKGRGNSTWAGSEKKPYQLKFSEKQNLFGIGNTRSWVLLANAFDETNIRNSLGMYVAKKLELDYTNSGEFVELYFNDVYNGLYFLTQKVNINTASVNIKNENAILMELDSIYGTEKEKTYVSKNNETFTIRDTVNKDPETMDKNAQNFLNSYNELIDAVKEKNWEKIGNTIDVDSFAKYYIAEYFTLNWDAFSTSTYFYKDGEMDKIHAGPVWDFDNAFGYWINNFYNRRSVEYNNLEPKYQSDLFFDLMLVKEFREKVTEIVKTKLLPNEDNMMNFIYETTKKLEPYKMRDDEKLGRENSNEQIIRLAENIKSQFNVFRIYFENIEELKDGYYNIRNLNKNFEINLNEDGSYTLTDYQTKKYLSSPESYSEYETASYLNEAGTIWQEWDIRRDNEGKCYIFSRATNNVLAVDELGNLKLKPFEMKEEEKFEIAEIGVFPLDTFIINEE